MALKRCFCQSQGNYSHEISKLSNFPFLNKNTCHHDMQSYIFQNYLLFPVFHGLDTCSIWILISLRLDYDQTFDNSLHYMVQRLPRERCLLLNLIRKSMVEYFFEVGSYLRPSTYLKKYGFPYLKKKYCTASCIIFLTRSNLRSKNSSQQKSSLPLH